LRTLAEIVLEAQLLSVVQVSFLVLHGRRGSLLAFASENRAELLSIGTSLVKTAHVVSETLEEARVIYPVDGLARATLRVLHNHYDVGFGRAVPFLTLAFGCAAARSSMGAQPRGWCSGT
jgi:hypothetical protein